MSRVGGEGRLKKHRCCTTCFVVCLIVLLLFVATIFVGGNILFKQFVSPRIGGASLSDVLSLAKAVFSGKEMEPDYTQEDLDGFYTSLSHSLFLSDYSNDELQYLLLDEQVKCTLADSTSVAAAEENASESFDKETSFNNFTALTNAERYNLLADSVKENVNQEQFANLSAEANSAVRDALGLKLYRLNLGDIVSGLDFEGDYIQEAMDIALDKLAFNFETLADYDVDNPNAEANASFNSISLTGKETSAFINDLITAALSGASDIIGDKTSKFLPEDADLASFLTIASVTIKNTPLAVSGTEALYNQKDTALSLALCVRLRDLVLTALDSDQFKGVVNKIPSFAFNLIKKAIPKYFSAEVSVYPLAEQDDARKMEVSINATSKKDVATLDKIVDGLLGDSPRGFFGDLNDKVASTFTSINDKVKINFIPSQDENGDPLKDEQGHTASELQIMTIDSVLSLFDDQGTISDHDIFSMLKCLYVNVSQRSPIDYDQSLTDLKASVETKYGIEQSFWKGFSINDNDFMNSIMDSISIDCIDFKEVDEMKVKISTPAFAGLMIKMLEDQSEDTSTSAAGESDFAELLSDLNIKICEFRIAKVSESETEKIMTVDLNIALDIASLMESVFPKDESATSSIIYKLLPKKDTNFGVRLFVSEKIEDDRTLHNVGGDIDASTREEGEKTLYGALIRINDFTFDQTSSVIETLNKVFELVGNDGFDIASITTTIEDVFGELFSTIENFDFKVNLSFVPEEGEEKGGLLLPSIYELVSAATESNLAEGEHFGAEDAREVLVIIYADDVDTTKTFEINDSDGFLRDINDKYYITYNSQLTAGDLFPEETAGDSSLSDKLDASSIYFTPSSSENALWKLDAFYGESYEKQALYSDTRSINALRVALTGNELASLLSKSGALSTQAGETFNSLEVLGCHLTSENSILYLSFDLLCGLTDDEDTSASDEDGESSFDMNKLLPSKIKVSAKVLLYSLSNTYEADAPRYSTTIKINDASATKIFTLLASLGQDSFSEQSISDTFKDAFSSIFDKIEETIPFYYLNSDGACYTNENSENCILLADVYSCLIKKTTMKDSATEDTTSEDLALRLRGFALQTREDTENVGDYSWVNGLKLFDDTDDDYVCTNMQDAYFMKNKPNLDTIYDDLGSYFSSINDTTFNLSSDSNGLFYYNGDIKHLKISDRALGVIINSKQNFGNVVNGEGITVDLMSVKITYDDDIFTLYSGVKIAFDRTLEKYAMMPSYFFVTAITREDSGSTNGYTTTISINNIGENQTFLFFSNLASLSSVGVTADSFNISTMQSQINDAIGIALNSFTNSVNITYGTFTQTEITNEYGRDIYTDDHVNLVEGDGYMMINSVYGFMIDLLYDKNDPNRPTEKNMQHMLNSLHSTSVENNVVKNKCSENAPTIEPKFTGMNIFTDTILLYADTALGAVVNESIKTDTVNGNIPVGEVLQTIIIPSSNISYYNEYWKSKFRDYNLDSTHNYLIATIKTTLDSAQYSSGDASIVPENLYLTVLIDLDDTSANNDNSRGLLYDMDGTDMNIFEYIINKNATNQENGFSLDSIAKQLASIIKNALNDLSSSLGGNVKYTYNRKTDSFTYYDDLSCTNEHDFATAEENNGVGYLVISKK